MHVRVTATCAVVLGALLWASVRQDDACAHLRWRVVDEDQPACHAWTAQGIEPIGAIDDCATVCERLHWSAASKETPLQRRLSNLVPPGESEATEEAAVDMGENVDGEWRQARMTSKHRRELPRARS